MSNRSARVGPVLDTSAAARAVVAAIRELNADVLVEDRGSYLRVLVPHRCIVTRAAIEAVLGQPFRLPADLEPLMPALKGRLSMTEDAVIWAFGSAA